MEEEVHDSLIIQSIRLLSNANNFEKLSLDLVEQTRGRLRRGEEMVQFRESNLLKTLNLNSNDAV